MRLQCGGYQPGDVHKRAAACKEKIHCGLVGGVEHYATSATVFQHLPGQPETGKSAFVRFMKGKRLCRKVKRRYVDRYAARPEQAGRNGHAHVRRAELGKLAAIVKFHKRMHHGLRMHQHLDAFGRHAVEVKSLNDLQPLVHERGRINGDLGPHAPVGMLEGLLRRNGAQGLECPAAKRPAGGCENEPFHFLPAPGKALKNGIVLGIHR